MTLSFLGTLICMLIMRPIETFLTQNSPYGVLDLEFMLTPDQATRILAAWGSEGIAKEIFVTYVDMGFLVSYSVLISFLNLIIIRSCLKKQIFLPNQSFPIIIGFFFPFIAAIFDLIENLNLLTVMHNPIEIPRFAPAIATIFASLKFGFLIISILFCVLLLLIGFIRKNS